MSPVTLLPLANRSCTSHSAFHSQSGALQRAQISRAPKSRGCCRHGGVFEDRECCYGAPQVGPLSLIGGNGLRQSLWSRKCLIRFKKAKKGDKVDCHFGQRQPANIVTFDLYVWYVFKTSIMLTLLLSHVTNASVYDSVSLDSSCIQELFLNNLKMSVTPMLKLKLWSNALVSKDSAAILEIRSFLVTLKIKHSFVIWILTWFLSKSLYFVFL